MSTTTTAAAVTPERVDRELAETMNSAAFEQRPFLVDFAQGRIDKAKLAAYAPSYCYMVDQFKRFVAAVYANAEPRDVRELMLENLNEEHGEGDPSRDHTTLVARFARALGASIPDEYDFDALDPIPEAREWVRRIFRICKEEHFVAGLAALSYGIEARTQTMAFLGTVYRDKYGVPEEDLEFFTMHLEADEDHAGRAIALIRKYCTTEDLLERCKKAVREVLDVTGVIFEGMERVCR